MRICYVADGASIHTQRWVNHFAGKGHQVHLICWKIMPGYDESVRVHRLTRLAPRIWKASQYPSFLLWTLQVRRLIRRIKPDVADGHFVTVYGFLAACSGFHPLVVTSWGSDLLIQPGRNPLARLTARYALRRADSITCLFPIEIAGGLVNELGIDLGKLRMVLLGVNTTEFSPSRRDEGVRPGLGIARSQPVIISTRSLAPLYDIETLIKAMPLVLAEVQQARFVVVGAGNQQDYLQQLARDLAVSNAVTFTGSVPRAELPGYLAAADVYVSTSLSDGASNSLLEAMACQLAPVVTDIPANRPWVTDGGNGFLFPARDHNTLAAKIVHLLKDRQTGERFGRSSREMVRENAEESTQMAKLEAIYRDLVEAQ